MRVRIEGAIATLIALTLILPAPGQVGSASEASPTLLESPTALLDFSRIKADVQMFSSIRSRFTGYPGSYEAAGLIIERFKSLELNVFTHNYTTLVPLDRGSSVKVGSREFTAYSLYPNVVAYGPRLTTGRLVDVRDGSLESLRGIDVDGKIALMDFDSGDNWINAVKLGAKAVIFYGGKDSSRFEALNKVANVPLNIPRLYIEDAEAQALIALANDGAEAEVVVGMRWEEVLGINIVGELRGRDPREADKVIMIITHYDSASVIPALAPGAEDAIGVSMMLELARKLTANRPKYTVWFIAMSGHWQALAGARAFIEDLYFKESKIGKELYPYLAFCIDLSSGSTKPNLVLTGWLHRTNTQFVGQRLTDLRTLLQSQITNPMTNPNADISKLNLTRTEFETLRQINSTVYSEGLISLLGLSRDSVGAGYMGAGALGFAFGMSFRYILDIEPFVTAGTLAVGAITINDMRPRFFSLSDTFDRVDMDGAILPQVRFVEIVLATILRSGATSIFSYKWDDDQWGMKPQLFRDITKIKYLSDTGFLSLAINTVTYNPLKAAQYDNVTDALVVVYDAVNAPFYRFIARSNSSGWAVVDGLVPTIGAMAVGRYTVKAYRVDEEGLLTFAPDDGPHGAGGTYSRTVGVTGHMMKVRTALFECGTVVATDLTCPLTLQALSSPDSLYYPRNAYANEIFRWAGYESPLTVSVVPFKIVGYAAPDSWGSEFDADRSIEIVYVPTGIGFGLLVRATSLSKPVGLFVNATASNPDGYGYVLPNPGDQLLVRAGLIGQYQDLLVLAAVRHESQRNEGVIDPTATRDIENALHYDRLVSQFLDEDDNLGAFVNGLTAWGFAQAAYTSSLGVLRDSVTSVIMTFALAIPFVILFSALAYGLTRGRSSMVLTSAVAIIVALILSFSHPGFVLAANVPAIFMGVVIVALVLPAMLFLFANFSTALSELRRAVFGEHFLERSGFEVSFSAISIGLGNMRKRPFRTILTMSSIVLVAFALSSLTSVTLTRVVKEISYDTEVPYNGVLIHTPSFFPMDRDRLMEVANFLGAYEVSERYWVYLPGSARIGVPAGIPIRFGTKTFEVPALAGVSPVETKGSFADSTNFIVTGSMFTSEDEYSCLLPQDLAVRLGVTVNDTVNVLGTLLRVRGIYDPAKMSVSVKDSDGYTDIFPLDYNRMSTEQRFDVTFTFGFGQIIIIPSGIARIFPEGCLTSAFIPLSGQDIEDTFQKIRTLFSAFEGINFYLTLDGKVYQFSKETAQSMFGIEFLLIPLVMAGLVTMSTVLGGVMERLREAGIYSSLGLAPLQVGLMFLTENVVYAIVGGMLGYLAGVSVSSVFRIFGILGEMVTNYTSLSVALAIGTIVVLVILASVYPMYRVALIVTPSLERRWRLETRPKGDVWEIPIPFRVKDEEKAMGIAAFLKEYLWNKRIERSEDFTVEDVSTSKQESTLTIRSRVWLPPYEQNIRHDVEMTLTKSKTELKYLINMKMKRVSGPHEAWVKFSYPFVDEVRKQLLMWSLLTPAQEERYIKQAVEEFGGGEE